VSSFVICSLICQLVRNFLGLLPQNFPISRSSCSPWYSFTQMFSGLSPSEKASLACPTAVICGGAVLQLIWSKSPISCFTASQGELDIYLNPNIVGELILSVNGRLIKGSAYFQVLRILKDMWGGANLPVMVLRLNVEPDQWM